MKKLLIGLIIGLFISGCATVPKIHYPTPFKPVRPSITFIDSKDDEGKMFISLTPEDARQLMNYVLQLEMELDKCSTTVYEINK